MSLSPKVIEKAINEDIPYRIKILNSWYILENNSFARFKHPKYNIQNPENINEAILSGSFIMARNFIEFLGLKRTNGRFRSKSQFIDYRNYLCNEGRNVDDIWSDSLGGSLCDINNSSSLAYGREQLIQIFLNEVNKKVGHITKNMNVPQPNGFNFQPVFVLLNQLIYSHFIKNNKYYKTFPEAFENMKSSLIQLDNNKVIQYL